MTDQPETVDPIANMPSQLQAANRRKRAAKNSNPASQSVTAAPMSVDADQPPPWFVAWLEGQQRERSSQFVESAPEAKPHVHVADDEELTPFQQSLRDQTSETPLDFKPPKNNYNYPLRHFAKPDGSIVRLQGDPGNRALYRDKGYVELTPDQVRAWYGGEFQKVLMVQREKADLINSMREQLSRDPSLRASIPFAAEQAWDKMTVPELQAYMDELMNIPDQHGNPRKRLKLPQRLVDAENRRSEAEAKRMLAGVETSETVTMEDLHRKIERGTQAVRPH